MATSELIPEGLSSWQQWLANIALFLGVALAAFINWFSKRWGSGAESGDGKPTVDIESLLSKLSAVAERQAEATEAILAVLTAEVERRALDRELNERFEKLLRQLRHLQDQSEGGE